MSDDWTRPILAALELELAAIARRVRRTILSKAPMTGVIVIDGYVERIDWCTARLLLAHGIGNARVKTALDV